MTVEAVVIDREKCIGCGACAADCVSNHIELVEGRAQTLPNRCIECGHCYAVCPAGAVDMPGYDLAGLDDTLELSEFGADRFLLALESRRSVRRFTADPVSDGDIARILEAGRFCPTGSNRQGVHFVVLREKLAEAEILARETFLASGRLASLVMNREGNAPDERFFFKGAPLAIAVAGKRGVDPALAAAYMELMAESLGLGAFYSGFFAYAAQNNAALRDLLGLPTGVEVVTTLVIGHGDVSYLRRVPRKPANIIWR